MDPPLPARWLFAAPLSAQKRAPGDIGLHSFRPVLFAALLAPRRGLAGNDIRRGNLHRTLTPRALEACIEPVSRISHGFLPGPVARNGSIHRQKKSFVNCP